MNNINKIYFQEKNKLNFESLKKSKINYLSDYWTQNGLKIEKI